MLIKCQYVRSFQARLDYFYGKKHKTQNMRRQTKTKRFLCRCLDVSASLLSDGCCVVSLTETFLIFFPPAALKTVLEVPMGSRFLRLNAKGPDMIGESTLFQKLNKAKLMLSLTVCPMKLVFFTPGFYVHSRFDLLRT